MILTNDIINKVITYKNINVIIKGSYVEYLTNLLTINKYKFIPDKNYYTYQGKFYIDIVKLKKKVLIDVLHEICTSPNYYSETIQKKVIILINFHLLHTIYQQSVKNIVDMTYNSCVFIIHSNNVESIDRNILSRFIICSLPVKSNNDETLQITYNRIIKLLKQKKLNSKVVETIRELSYMYYMNHTHSIDLQRLFVEKIGSNICIPNSVKYKLVEDMCRINKYYQHSYRKPIFLEFIIISLYKHLENYTYNL